MVSSTKQQKTSSAGLGSSDRKHSHFGSVVQHPYPTFGIPATPAFGTSFPGLGSSLPTFGATPAPCLANSMFIFSAGTSADMEDPSDITSQKKNSHTALGTSAFNRVSHMIQKCLCLALSQEARGTRIAPYAPTPQPPHHVPRIDSISAMPEYRNKSHDELRFEDYKLGNKGVASTPGAWCRPLRRHRRQSHNSLTTKSATASDTGQ